MWLNVGDAGPDQTGLRNSLHTELAIREDLDWMYLFSVACLKHQFHLAARGQLALVDWCLRAMNKPYKYFSSIATLCHTWRGHLKKLRAAWTRVHDGDEFHLNNRILLRSPPVAIAGRWASVDRYLLLWQFSMIEFVLSCCRFCSDFCMVAWLCTMYTIVKLRFRRILHRSWLWQRLRPVLGGFVIHARRCQTCTDRC